MNRTTSENRITYARAKTTRCLCVSFYQKTVGICSAYSRWDGMETPRSDSGTENLIIKISQTRRRNCIREEFWEFCLFLLQPPPGGPLPLCKHQYCQCLCYAVCAYSTVKNAEKIVEKKKIIHKPSFLQVTAITYRFFFFFFISISLSVFFTLNFSKRKACVKKHLPIYVGFRVGRVGTPVSGDESAFAPLPMGRRVINQNADRLNEPLPVRMYCIFSHIGNNVSF